MKTKQAFVTVGGSGSRLKEAGIKVPLSKSFLELNRKPIFYWCLQGLYKAGISKLVIVAETEEKINKAKKIISNFPHSFSETVFCQDKGLGVNGLPYHARKFLDKQFFFECGHHISKPGHYIKMDMAKDRGSIVLSSFKPDFYSQRCIVKATPRKIILTKKFSGAKNEFAVSYPKLLDKAYILKLPILEFDGKKIVEFYASVRKLKLVYSDFPIEIDVAEEMEKAFKIYKEYINENFNNL